MVIGLFITGMITSSCIDTLDIEIDSEKNFGMTHFFMMGMNYAEGGEGNGVWNQEDVEFSESISNAKERKQKNLQVAEDGIGIIIYISVILSK